ncbi:hypothetical protein [Granulicella mallensis]|jgi:hypothetical protein|uniref:Uncharacterized protein n=1 Tax=Granulicella mallensis TaxID=940614 RepID=A0A7W8EA16_9BACT|nr:hypothetical protein [Granulicella mallensis]MBB5062930.1 hypothetical protein [Granulicella mallensis]
MNADSAIKYLEQIQTTITSKIDDTLLLEPVNTVAYASTLRYKVFRQGHRLLPDFEIFDLIPKNDNEASRQIETMFRKYLQLHLLKAA